jgi:hypothetical protein
MNQTTVNPTRSRQIHPRCKGVALKLAIFFQHFDGSVPAQRLIEQANIPRPSIEGALTQGLLVRDGDEYRLTDYAQTILYQSKP